MNTYTNRLIPLIDVLIGWTKRLTVVKSDSSEKNEQDVNTNVESKSDDQRLTDTAATTAFAHIIQTRCVVTTMMEAGVIGRIKQQKTATSNGEECKRNSMCNFTCSLTLNFKHLFTSLYFAISFYL